MYVVQDGTVNILQGVADKILGSAPGRMVLLWLPIVQVGPHNFDREEQHNLAIDTPTL